MAVQVEVMPVKSTQANGVAGKGVLYVSISRSASTNRRRHLLSRRAGAAAQGPCDAGGAHLRDHGGISGVGFKLHRVDGQVDAMYGTVQVPVKVTSAPCGAVPIRIPTASPLNRKAPVNDQPLGVPSWLQTVTYLVPVTFTCMDNVLL